MKKLTTLLLAIAMVWTAAIPGALFTSYAVTDDQAAETEVVAQNPVANYDSEATSDAEPVSEEEASTIVEEPYNAETIVANAEAEQEYRDSVDYVEKRIVFSVHERRKKGDKAVILTSGDSICKGNGLTKVSKILETKTDKYGSEAGYVDYEVFYEARTKSEDVWAVVDALLATEGVMSAEPDIIWETADDGDAIPTEEEMADEWILDNQNASEMWGSLDGLPGEDVVVAVIDTGVDYTHKDLKGNMWINPNEVVDGIDNDGNGYADDIYGINLIANSGDPQDDNGHGTHVAGIIGMTAGNGGGVGLAYGAKIMAIKAGQQSGIFASTDIAKAIQYANDNGADVINMSFGGTGKSKLVEAALADAFASAVLIAAAGNDGLPTTDFPYLPREDIYPAGYSYVLGVMASDQNNELAGFSNWDYRIGANCEYEVVAPGVDIYSTLPGNRYARWSGTSMAAPVASAAAAIIRGQNPDKAKMSSRLIMGQLTSATNSYITTKYNRYPLIDIEDSLSFLPRPVLSVGEIFVFDSPDLSPANNGDGIIQNGETIDLGITVRNRWGAAKTVKVTADDKINGITNPYVEILTNEAEIGDVGTYSDSNNGFLYSDGELIGVENPIRVKIRETTPNDAQIALSLHVSGRNAIDDEDSSDYELTGTYIFSVMNGEYLNGTITEDKTLTADKYWIIQNNVLIPEDVTLTIEPGTKVQFWSSNYAQTYMSDPNVFIEVAGKLICRGTEDAPVEMFIGKNFEDRGILIQGDGITDDNFDKAYVELAYTYVETPYNHSTNYTQDKRFSVTKMDHCYLYQNIKAGLKPFDNYDWIYYGYVSAKEITNTRFISFYNENNCWWYHDAIRGERIDNSIFDNCTATITVNNIENSVFLENQNAVPSTSFNNIMATYNSLHKCAILNNLNNRKDTWLSISASPGDAVDFTDNYWGTTNETLIKAQVSDADNNVTLGDIVQEPYLTLESDYIADIYPFVAEAYITDESGENRLNNASNNQKVQMHVSFNRRMDQNIQPLVSFGGAEPYTDYAIKGDWLNECDWVGEFTIPPMCSEGTQYIRVKGGAAADDSWLVAGTDAARFHFVVARNSAESLNLQGTGGSNCNELMWIQDDYDTLAGYNLYRSTSYDKDLALSDQNFERINASLIAENTKEYIDTDVQQGVDYYYYFTVMDTDFNESVPSNVVKCTPLDEEGPVIAHDAVTAGTKGRQLSIDATLTDNVGVTSAAVRYRAAGSTSWQSADMKLISGNLYRGTISAYETKVESLEYYLEVSDGTNTTYNGSESNPHVIALSDEIFAESIELSDQAISIAPGSTRKITASIKPVDVTNTNVTWASSNEKIATVDNEGNIIGIKSGSAEITATASNGVSAACTVKVELQTDTTVYAESVITSKGDSVEVPVMIRSNSGISSMRLKFSYDPNHLTPTAIAKGDLLKSAYVTGNTNEPGTYYALFTNAKNISEDGLLYTITFDVARSAPDSGVDISISYESGDVSNASHEDVQITAETIHIGFEDAVLGDVYEDGRINSHDMTSMQQYLTELITFTKHQKFLADLTEDDKVNMQDMVALAQKYLNPTRSSVLSGLMSILGIGTSRFEGTIGSAELGDDMKVAIPVTFTASPDIAAYKFAVNYNGALYKLESIDSENTDNGSFMTNVDDAGTGRAVVTWYGNEDTDVSTHTMTLNFIAIADDISEESTVTMTYEDGDICDLEGKSYEAEIAAGTIYPNGAGVYDEPVFTWTGHTAATAYFKCLTDEANSKTLDAEITKEVIKEATATESGETKYTATVTFKGKEYTDVKVVETQYGVTEEEWQEAQEALEQALAEKDAALEAKAEAEASLAQAQTDLANAQAAITALNETIESKDATIEEKEAALAQANEDLAAAESSLTEAQEDLTDALTQLAAANTTITELQGTIEGKDEELAQASADLAAAQANLENTQAALETATANYNTTKAQLDEANETISTLQNQLSEKEAALTQALAEKDAALEAKAAAEASLTQAQTDLANAQSTITALNETIESKDATIEEKEAALAKANEDLATAEASLVQAQEELTAVNAQLAAANAKIASYEASSDDKDKELAQAKADLAAAQTELAATQTALTAATANYNNTKAQLDAANETISSLQSQMAENEAALTQALADKDAALEAKAAAEVTLAQAQTDLTNAQATITALNETIESKDATIEEKEAALDQANQDLAAAQASLAQAQEELTVVNTQLAAANAKIASYESSADDKDKELAQAKADLAVAQADLANAQAALATATINYNNTKAQLDEAVLEVADLRDQLATAESDLAAKTEELIAARDAETQAKAEAKAAKEAEAAAKADAEAASQKVKELTQQKTELEKQLADSGTENGKIKAELEKVKTDLATAREEKEAADAALATARTEREQAIAAKKEAEERAAAAEAEVEKIKELIGAADLKNASIAIQNADTLSFTGSDITPAVTVTYGGKTLTEGADYSLYYVNNIWAGTATVIVIGEGEYAGYCKATFEIKKAENPITVKIKKTTIKAKSVKKKTQTVTATKAFTVKDAQGPVTFEKLSGNKKITIAHDGKIKVKKGLKKGKYKVKIAVTAEGDNNYEAGSVTVTKTIYVK